MVATEVRSKGTLSIRTTEMSDREVSDDDLIELPEEVMDTGEEPTEEVLEDEELDLMLGDEFPPLANQPVDELEPEEFLPLDKTTALVLRPMTAGQTELKLGVWEDEIVGWPLS